MAIDTSALKFPKSQKGRLRVEVKRGKELADSVAERRARKAVRLRDGGRCVVDGCKERSRHLHHIVYRSQSKRLRWATSNLCSLCVWHHAMEHAGRITIAGNANKTLLIMGDSGALKCSPILTRRG